MTPTDHSEIIKKLLSRPKVQQIVLFKLFNENPYYSIVCKTKAGNAYAVLIDEGDFSLLSLGRFALQHVRSLPYLRMYRGGIGSKPEYLHRMILPSPPGFVTHHAMDQFDVRRESLQSVPRSLHAAFHREMHMQRPRPIHPKNHFLF